MPDFVHKPQNVFKFLVTYRTRLLKLGISPSNFFNICSDFDQVFSLQNSYFIFFLRINNMGGKLSTQRNRFSRRLPNDKVRTSDCSVFELF